MTPKPQAALKEKQSLMFPLSTPTLHSLSQGRSSDTESSSAFTVLGARVYSRPLFSHAIDRAEVSHFSGHQSCLYSAQYWAPSQRS